MYIKVFQKKFWTQKGKEYQIKDLTEYFFLSKKKDLLYPEEVSKEEIQKTHVSSFTIKSKEKYGFNPCCFNDIPYKKFILEIECTATSEDGKKVVSEFIGIFNPFPER